MYWVAIVKCISRQGLEVKKRKKKIESDCVWEKNVPGEENEIIYDMWPCNNKELSSCVLSVKGNRASDVSRMGFIS